MSRFTVRLPETLHVQLASLADREGVSLNQYIVFALTRQATLAYTVRCIPESEVAQQRATFTALLQSLGQGSPEEVKAVLDAREPAEPEPELTPDIVARLRARIAGKAA